MPERPTRRAWTARVPLRLVIVVLAALATLAATACTEDDGLSPYRPDRGIAGTWVRYHPGDSPLDVAPAPRDTLFLAADGWGRWSYETETGAATPARGEALVQLDVQPPFLFLNYAPPCPNCQAGIAANRVATLGPPAAPRRESRIDAPHYRVARDGRDLIQLVPVWDPAWVQYFRRISPPATDP